MFRRGLWRYRPRSDHCHERWRAAADHTDLQRAGTKLAVEDGTHARELRSLAERPGDAAVRGAPAPVLGIRGLPRQVRPILDSAAFLGLTRDGELHWVVVVEDRGRPGGLAVDAVADVRPAPPGEETPSIDAGPLLDSLAKDAS